MILSILKVIGLILLIILCVLLVLILILLFVPIRYKAEFEYDSGHMRLDGRVTWLASLVRCYAGLKGKKFFYKVKILFFSLMDSERVTGEKERIRKKEPEKQTPVKQETAEQDAEPVEKVEPAEEIKPEEPKTPEEEPDITEGIPQEAEKKTSEKPKKPRKEFRLPFTIMHPADIYDKIIRTLMDLSRKLDKICEQIVSEENRATVVFVLGQVKELLYHIRPRKHGIYLKLGMKDPALTGQIMGAYSVLNSVFGMNFILEPYFDREILEAKLYVKGHIRVISLIIIAIRLYRNKTIRKLIRRK